LKGREGKGREGEEQNRTEQNRTEHSCMTKAVWYVGACGMLAGACMPGALFGGCTEGGHCAGSSGCPAI